MNLRASKATALGLCLVAMASLAWTGVGQCQFTARLFTTGTNTSINLSAAKWCVNVEPVNNAFQVSSIDFTTVFLFSNTYPITGSVDRINPMNKTYVQGDKDANGIPDVEVCFSNADINALFSNLHGKKPKTVNLGLTGNLITGGFFSGPITIDVYPKN